MASAAGAEGRRFDNINLLRAFAALSVVVYHVIEHGNWTTFPAEGPLLTFRVGWLGVDLFFVISGFVITYSALILYRADAADFRGRYWARRLTRILPLYLATLFLWLALFPPPHWDAREWARQLATHLTFTHSFSPRTHGSIDGPNWSLAIEMHFYLAIALGIRWLDRLPGWWILAAGLVVSWVWRAVVFQVSGGGDAHLLFIRLAQLPGTLDEFAGGMFLAKLFLDGRRPWFAHGWPWVAAACATGYVTMRIYWGQDAFWETPAMVIMWRSLLAAFFTCVVGAAIALPQWIATRALRPIEYLGETSYGIYLWHLFAVQIVILQWGWKEVPALVAVVAVTVALAMLSWHAFEKPFMRLARRDARLRPSPSVVS
jgi:peptidoglycan/LPS O-acetylase OafA/YrhL